MPQVSLIRRGKEHFAVGIGVAPDGLEALIDARPTPMPTVARARPLTRKAAWNQGMRTLLSEIDAGKIQKCVLARSLQVSLSGPVALLPLLARMRTLQGDCTVFAMARKDQAFVGATPEILFRRNDRVLSSVALAGSIRRDPDPKVDRALSEKLKSDPKERREHALVKDAVMAELARFGDASAGALQIRKLRNVQHLQTKLRATLRDLVTHASLLEALHPTPAVCGTPRKAARKVLRQIESFDRGWYAGPVGIIGAQGEAHFAVAIRSMLLGPSMATLFAGAGIVEGSVAQREWDETALKSQAMLRALENGAS